MLNAIVLKYIRLSDYAFLPLTHLELWSSRQSDVLEAAVRELRRQFRYSGARTIQLEVECCYALLTLQAAAGWYFEYRDGGRELYMSGFITYGDGRELRRVRDWGYNLLCLGNDTSDESRGHAKFILLKEYGFDQLFNDLKRWEKNFFLGGGRRRRRWWGSGRCKRVWAAFR